MMQEEMSANDTEIKTHETRRIMKNVVVVSLAFMVNFTAYWGAVNLQSSINADAGLGTSSLVAINSGLIFSTLFLPAIFVKWLGLKWTMFLSFITYMPYIIVQMMPTFYTMIPAGLLLGLGAGPLWSAKGTYLTMLAEAHSKISKISVEALLIRFLGIFFMIFCLNQVWGNMISSLVLTSGDNVAAVTSLNASQIPELCGANFLPAAHSKEALTPQPPERIQMIAGIYLALMAGAALIVAFGVDSINRFDCGRTLDHSQSGLALLAVTLKLLKEPNQLLLGVISTFNGYQEAFFCAGVTSAFVTCALGTGSVGFVMMTFGISSAGGCVTTGYLAKVTGRLPLMFAAALVHSALFLTVLLWRPQADSSHVIYSMAVPWGLCNSIWVVLINANFGILFPGREDAAFAVCYLWKAVGFIIAYVSAPYLRTSSKTYLMIAMMLVGVMGYITVEVRVRKSRSLEISKEVAMNKIASNVCDNVGFQKDL